MKKKNVRFIKHYYMHIFIPSTYSPKANNKKRRRWVGEVLQQPTPMVCKDARIPPITLREDFSAPSFYLFILKKYINATNMYTQHRLISLMYFLEHVKNVIDDK